ncbi:type II secretion system protein N [Pigmentiphaga aceris]|uniref:Type II secretion system protein N n=1 Tax=Pigmentiphaga aceris TaxID=1940612 RepID=A0A5C0B3R4_9BURK|nr:type II secretion system protein N [Pigmentiphaga aceris]QEI08486.1 type II secretion system protein N [Pigmentiphaga aceris]
MSTRRRMAASIGLVCIAIAAALAVMPARWLLRVLPDRGLVALVDADGSIWQGRAQLAFGPPGNRRSLPARAAWSWRWAGGPAVSIVHPWLESPLLLRLSGRDVVLPANMLRLPADTLSALGAPFNTLQPTGELMLRWPAQRLSGGVPQGELLTLQWDDAAAALSRIRPLGSYRARLTGDGRGMDLGIDTLSGVFQVQGTGRWERGALQFSGAAQAAATATSSQREALQGLLSALGRRDGDRALLDIRSLR